MTTKVILILAVCVSFGAGLLIGLESGKETIASPTLDVATRPATEPTTRGRRGFLTAELGLTPDQQAQMKEIWESSMRDAMRQHEEKRREYRRQRDERILALVPDEKRAEYDAVLERYSKATDDLENEMRAVFERNVELTREILNPEQRAKYQKIREVWQRDRGARRDRDQVEDSSTRPSGEGATTRPS